ncbi:MAG: mechanosensitive ion channel protein MscS, partial [Erythrobacteraceae bacterium]
MNYIATLREQLQEMGQGFVEALPTLAIAVFIVFLTWIIARFAARISDVIVGRTELRTSLKTLIDTLVKLAIWI